MILEITVAIKQRFQKLLHQKLREKYGSLPSCPRLARDFSLIAQDVAPITSETARKWLRGQSLPHASRLNILCQWLGIEMDALCAMPQNNERRSKLLNYSLMVILEQLDERELETVRGFANALLKERLRSYGAGLDQ